MLSFGLMYGGGVGGFLGVTDTKSAVMFLNVEQNILFSSLRQMSAWPHQQPKMTNSC